jgi:hypothetical protein
MQVNELEELAARLDRLRKRLDAASPADTPLPEDSPLVQAARECEFMLPPSLSVRTLSETVDRKIANVSLLLERAKKQEDLSIEAPAADEQDYIFTEDDYLLRGAGSHPDSRMQR